MNNNNDSNSIHSQTSPFNQPNLPLFSGSSNAANSNNGSKMSNSANNTITTKLQKMVKVMKKYISFLGPGIMVSVSFMDPGNYSTSVTASKFQYKLLFSIFISNLMAIFLQLLCAKLGAVTGLDLAQNCKKNFSPRLNIALYILTEIAIIATDLAEVIGTAISLNILFNIPLFLGVVLTIIDVLIVLMAYRPNGPMIIVRIFEAFVSCLVLGTVICFAIELVTVSNSITFQEIFNGFLPSKTVIENDGLYISLAILGATVMPHSLYLGSGLVQPRLKEYDVKHGNYIQDSDSNDDGDIIDESYRPSIDAINETMAYTITELIVSLFTVALFVNSSILIIAAATFNNNKENGGDETGDADLFTIYYLLSSNLSKTAGMIFALALLFSGLSAGVVCTLAGQMVSEGFLEWTISPSLRRIITRSIAIVPCLVLSLVSGREGLSNILNFSQVILSFLLPIVSAPLIIFTNSRKIMKVEIRKGSLYHQNSIEAAASSAASNESPIRNSNIDEIDATDSSSNAIQLRSLAPRNHTAASISSDYDIDEEDSLHQDTQKLLPTDTTVSTNTVINDASEGMSANVTATSNLHLHTAGSLHEDSNDNADKVVAYKDMSNGRAMKIMSIIIWLFITVLNFYLVFSLAMGKDIPL